MLQSLEKSMTSMTVLHDKGKEILDTTSKIVKESTQSSNFEHVNCPEPIFKTPERMKINREHRRRLLEGIGIDDSALIDGDGG